MKDRKICNTHVNVYPVFEEANTRSEGINKHAVLRIMDKELKTTGFIFSVAYGNHIVRPPVAGPFGGRSIDIAGVEDI